MLMSTLDRHAIEAALAGRWSEAVTLNKKILEEERENIDVLNRLAYAFAKSGNYEEACRTYKTVLTLDAYNPLALKNLSKFKQQDTNTTSPPQINGGQKRISPAHFLSDAQKTKSVNLIHITSRTVLQSVSVGEEVFPLPRRFELHIKDKNNVYLGALPDDIGHPLLKLLKQKNASCQFIIKDVNDTTLTIFIKY